MSVDILGTSCDHCRSMVQYRLTSTETRRLVRTDSPGRPPRLSHSSWTMTLLSLRILYIVHAGPPLRHKKQNKNPHKTTCPNTDIFIFGRWHLPLSRDRANASLPNDTFNIKVLLTAVHVWIIPLTSSDEKTLLILAWKNILQKTKDVTFLKWRNDYLL